MQKPYVVRQRIGEHWRGHTRFATAKGAQTCANRWTADSAGFREWQAFYEPEPLSKLAVRLRPKP